MPDSPPPHPAPATALRQTARAACDGDSPLRAARGTLCGTSHGGSSEAIEIVSKHGNAVLVPAEDYAALREGSYLLRSPANARRLLTAYENALGGTGLSERALIDPDAADAT